MSDTDILIVGGGLSGLSLGAELTKQKRDFILLEARSRLGGRILDKLQGTSVFDMGPAWFWPGQPRIAALIYALGLSHFDQYFAGDLMFEDEHGRAQRGRGFASMQGSYRLCGGLGALIKAVAAQIEQERIVLNTPVTHLIKTENGITVQTSHQRKFTARQVVLALPPRIASTLSFGPELPAGAQTAMESIPTWMAGQAKAMAIYDRPFWREAGLSGDAMSRSGPLAEIHDATPDDEEFFALFGFVGIPAEHRRDVEKLETVVRHQLVRLFGAHAAHPVALHLKDWALDPFTAQALDLQPLHTHPNYGLPGPMANLWDGNLIFGGTEIAPQFGGYLEGALEAAEIALRRLDLIDA